MFDWQTILLSLGCVSMVLQGVRMTRHWQKMPTIERRREIAFACWYGLLLLSVFLSRRTQLDGLTACVDVALIVASVYWLVIGGASRQPPRNGAA